MKFSDTLSPNLSDPKKKIHLSTSFAEYDGSTGEIRRSVQELQQYVPSEPNYIKVYTDCMLLFNNMDVALSPFIVAFGRHMTYASGGKNPNFRCTVRTDEMTRQDVAEQCHVSDARVKQIIKELVDCGVFIPIEINGKKKRGVYYVNPWVVSKGDWKDIRELRGEFEFTSGKAGVLMIDDDGNRKVLLSESTINRGQLELLMPEMRKKGLPDTE